jgi:D-glycero-alpha-D-manno-heptose-7-phosphate kinase
LYTAAISAGALGGKLLGAGGGGFVLFFVEPSKQDKIRKALKSLLEVPIKFENLGSQIIFYQPESGLVK